MVLSYPAPHSTCIKEFITQPRGHLVIYHSLISKTLKSKKYNLSLSILQHCYNTCHRVKSINISKEERVCMKSRVIWLSQHCRLWRSSGWHNKCSMRWWMYFSNILNAHLFVSIKLSKPLFPFLVFPKIIWYDMITYYLPVTISVSNSFNTVYI